MRCATITIVRHLRLICFFAAGLLMAQAPADPAASARKALDLLLAEKYSELFPMFTPEMQRSVTEPALAKIGAQLKAYGAVTKIDDPTVQKAGPNTIVVFPVHFEKQNINFRYLINGAGQVSGFFQLPGAAAWVRPDYSKPGSFTEREVTIGTDQWKLPGTLTVPAGAGPFPGIVLVHASGPNDRDETVFGTKVFKDLAEGLASRGIAVLRYEKRTRIYASRVQSMPEFSIDEETVTDAARAAELLRAQKEINPRRIYVLGHGLGGYISPRIIEEDGKLAGVVVLAGHARPLEDLAVEQAEYLGLTAQQIQSLKTQVAKVKALEHADADAPKVMGMTMAYLLDLKGYDPVASAKKLTVPMLFLQGERDFQVPSANLALWKAGLSTRKDVAFKSYPALNHLFVAGEGKGNEAEYRKPGHVAPEVIEDIVKFIGQ
jgi:uncharacterized protein